MNYILNKIREWWALFSDSKTKTEIVILVLILMIDIGISISIPYNMRKVNNETKFLYKCKSESGYQLFSNCCDITSSPSGNSCIPGDLTNEYRTSLFAAIVYACSLAFSLALLFLSSMYTTKSVSYNKWIDRLYDSKIIILTFSIRNVTMFNLANYVSRREGQIVIISVVKMEAVSMFWALSGAFCLAIILHLSFPAKDISGELKGWHSHVYKTLVFGSWFVIMSSLIYYIGATNVLGRNVLSMYDLRGPELLIMNYWNYGILLIIYCEFILLLKILSNKDENREMVILESD